VSAREDRAAVHRQEIDALLEAAGAFAPGLEQEARQTREQLAELVR
jgi:hypothetical protein